MKRKALEVSLAVSEAVKLANVDVVAAYPITPQTHIVEHLAEIVANGELNAEYINVESEHSAMSACVGASAAGARSFTSSSSQGLALMHEILFIASGLRLPIVMAVVNRALSAPLNIWGDQSDVMSERDCGWIQLFAANGQEAFDLTLQAFKIGEDRRVLLPVMVNLDGFSLSHVIEPIFILEEDEVKKFLQDYVPQYKLDPDNPMTFGAYGMPDIYTEAKKAQDEVLRDSKKVIIEVFEDFKNLFKREYKPVRTYKADDAETLILTLGGITETCKVAIDEMRNEGKKVGLVNLTLWRPFPEDEIKQAVSTCKTLAVVDRAISPGGCGGPVFAEIRSYLYNEEKRPKIHGFILGLGGRDVTVDDFKQVFNLAEKGEKEFQMLGVRE